MGLAGGLNAYGFANGDPVAYSDPFGLCLGPLIAYCPEIIEGVVYVGAAILTASIIWQQQHQYVPVVHNWGADEPRLIPTEEG